MPPTYVMLGIRKKRTSNRQTNDLGNSLERLIQLQLLVFQLALQFLSLSHLAHSLVEVVLVDGVPVILDRKQTANGC